MVTFAAAHRWLWWAILCAAAFAAVTVWVSYSDGPSPFDAAVAAAVLTARTATLNSLATAVTALGSAPVVAAVAVAAAFGLRWRTGRLLLPMTLLITVAEAAAVVYVIKEVVGRDRPPTAWLIGTPSTDGSFPSGHTTNGSVVYVLAAILLTATLSRRWVRRLAVASAAILAVGVGLTRVYLGFHWASDVLGGWLLAATFCSVAGFAVCRLRDETELTGATDPGIDETWTSARALPASSPIGAEAQDQRA